MSTFEMITKPPCEATPEEIAEVLSRTVKEPYPLCYFCGHLIGPDEEGEDHHPDGEGLPNWTEPAHADCHQEYHSRNGD